MSNKEQDGLIIGTFAQLSESAASFDGILIGAEGSPEAKAAKKSCKIFYNKLMGTRKNGVIHNSFDKKMDCDLAMVNDEDLPKGGAEKINKFLAEIDESLNENDVVCHRLQELPGSLSVIDSETITPERQADVDKFLSKVKEIGDRK